MRKNKSPLSNEHKIVVKESSLTSSLNPEVARLFAKLMRKHARMFPDQGQENLARQWDEIANRKLN